MYRDEFGVELDNYIEKVSFNLYKDEFIKTVFNT